MDNIDGEVMFLCFWSVLRLVFGFYWKLLFESFKVFYWVCGC